MCSANAGSTAILLPYDPGDMDYVTKFVSIAIERLNIFPETIVFANGRKLSRKDSLVESAAGRTYSLIMNGESVKAIEISFASVR